MRRPSAATRIPAPRRAVNTDVRQADFSKVAGLVSFCIDIRSRSTDTLQRMDQRVQQAADALAKAHRVRFDLGARSGSQAAAMDGTLQTSLSNAAAALGLRAHRLPSGAGHDAAVFANAGVPTAMLFVRNAQGSHNPDEALAMDDFSAATRVLGRVLGNRAGLSFPLQRKA
jgi:N-carbamoyl-L-amino-acid hydrolase